MLGPLLGGWLLWTRGFSTTFVTAGTLGVISVLLFFLMRLPPQAPHIATGVGATAVFHDLTRGARTVFGNVRVVVTSATDGGRQVANGPLVAFLPMYVIGIGLDAAQAGVLVGVQR